MEFHLCMDQRKVTYPYWMSPNSVALCSRGRRNKGWIYSQTGASKSKHQGKSPKLQKTALTSVLQHFIFSKFTRKGWIVQKEQIHFNFHLDTSKQKKKKNPGVLFLFPLLSARLGAPHILSSYFSILWWKSAFQTVGAETNQYDSCSLLQHKRSQTFITKHLRFTIPPHGSLTKPNKNWL